jgi:hypothetical protein
LDKLSKISFLDHIKNMMICFELDLNYKNHKTFRQTKWMYIFRKNLILMLRKAFMGFTLKLCNLKIVSMILYHPNPSSQFIYFTRKIQSTTSNWNTYRPEKSVPVRGSVPVRDNPYNLAYKATLHIKIALFCGEIRW